MHGARGGDAWRAGAGFGVDAKSENFARGASYERKGEGLAAIGRKPLALPRRLKFTSALMCLPTHPLESA